MRLLPTRGGEGDLFRSMRRASARARATPGAWRRSAGGAIGARVHHLGTRVGTWRRPLQLRPAVLSFHALRPRKSLDSGGPGGVGGGGRRLAQARAQEPPPGASMQSPLSLAHALRAAAACLTLTACGLPLGPD